MSAQRGGILVLVLFTSTLASAASPALKRVPGEANITIQGWMSPTGSFQGGCVDENCSGLQVVDQGDKVLFSIPFSKIQVGTGLVFGVRTDEMRKFFGSNARISVVIPKDKVELPQDGRKRAGFVTGMVSIKENGKSVQKKISYLIERSGKTYNITKGSFDIDLEKDFGIDTRQRIRKFSVYVRPHISIRDIEFSLTE